MSIETTFTTVSSVTVAAPARLHLGFLDLNASQGRKFGSLGLAVNSHYTQIRVSKAATTQISGQHLTSEQKQRIEKLLTQFYQNIGPAIPSSQQAVAIEVLQSIPEHAGLGSGTQLALVLTTALARLHQLTLTTQELAHVANRGKRSGIGIATFDRGGFVVDGGLKPEQIVPPLLMQHAYPSDWRIVLIMDPSHQGIHGQSETQAFRTLPPFPLDHSRIICHLTLMQLLPALVEHELDRFARAITEIQALVGDHFADAQGGRYSSPRVADCLLSANTLGFHGIAQSSWGPTGCVFVESEQAAHALIQQQHNADARLDFIIAAADNHGAIIESH